MADTDPLLPQPTPRSGDSHPITLRACHSPWKGLNQQMLMGVRLLLVGYLTAVSGISLKWKLENEDGHTKWRIPFQFSTVSFVMLWVYHLLVTLWTGMHLFHPRAADPDAEYYEGHRIRAEIARFLSPSDKSRSPGRRFAFSMFYTTSHVFAFMNTLIYWGVLVPAGHGGFKVPELPNHPHDDQPGNATALYDPNKGLFDEGGIKPFSIINVWTITSLIAATEIFFLNSIRRPTPVAGHIVGVMMMSALYLAWAALGKMVTGHAGLFFLDPKLMGDVPMAVVAACFAFVTMSPGIFSYTYGLIAMRESITANANA
ncbi:hypothetical protein F4780DRAFT_516941 [Xylariomycetidae sp. FL0641]|nr:hypothetical protein F4780DRAFT_516941 [Xylariomycetidae sp. FL0641]